MLSRMVVSSLALLFLAIVVLANGATSITAQATLPLTPPPFAPQPRRIGPIFAQPTTTTTPTVTITPTALLTPAVTVTATDVLLAPTATPTPTLLLTVTAVPTVTAAEAALPTTTSIFLLPTVTPTPEQHTVLPTPTPRAGTTARTDTRLPTPVVSPTGIPSGTLPGATPGLTTTVAANRTLTETNGPLPLSYIAQGNFASQTVHADGVTVQQQGSFTIEQAAAVNAYAANQHVALRTERELGEADEINVYQIDDYIAVSYTDGEWMLVRRDQGSNIVRAIQPITDLAVLFPRIIHQAEFMGQEEVAGASALRYRIDDPASQSARLIQPLLALTGEIRALQLEIWIAVPGAYVVAYNFQVELAGARVLDNAGNEVRADQTVTWTYQLTPNAEPEPIHLPAEAPSPTAFPVPGFAPGTFPMPPDTELLALVAGMPDLLSTQSIVAIDAFYRTELAALGWRVTGEGGLLTFRKEGTTLQMLISEDAATSGTRISVLPSE